MIRNIIQAALILVPMYFAGESLYDYLTKYEKHQLLGLFLFVGLALFNMTIIITDNLKQKGTENEKR